MKIFSSVSAILLSDVAIASPLRASGVRLPRRPDHTASCKPIETGQRPLGELVARLIETRSPASRPLPAKIASKVSTGDNSSAILALPLALLQHSPSHRVFE
jgi:hypothetical protein